MNFKRLLQSRHARLTPSGGPPAGLPRHQGHAHAWRAVSRRQFLGATAGAAGVLLGAGFFSPVQAADAADPRPIPGGFPFLDHFYHLLTPEHPMFGTGTADTEDPSSITDFNGHIGLAYVTGMGTHTDKTTGDVNEFPFEVDLRFMKGTYVGANGRRHHATFALV